MKRLAVAVVTGGARGIGRTIAHDLYIRGYRVVIGDLDLTATERTAAEIGSTVSAVRLDVTDGELVRDLVRSIETDIGPIDVWVNNAGVMPTGPFAQQPSTTVDAIVDVDFRAVVDLTAVVLPRMMKRRRGHIVNIASATGIKPLAGLAVGAAIAHPWADVVLTGAVTRRQLRQNVAAEPPRLAPDLLATLAEPPQQYWAARAARPWT